MKLYADRPDRVLRQLVGDLAVVILGYLAIQLGRATHSRIAELAAPGREAEATARQLDGQLRDTAGDLDDTPLVGGALSTPFKALASTSRDLAQQAQDYQDAVERFATLAGFLVAGFILLHPGARLAAAPGGLDRRGLGGVPPRPAYAGQRRPARRARAGPAAAAPAGQARSRGRRAAGRPATPRRRSGWPRLELDELGLRPLLSGSSGARPGERSGHGASAGRSESQPASRAAAAARIPPTVVGLCRRPASTRSRASCEGHPGGHHVALLVARARAARRPGRRCRPRAR